MSNVKTRRLARAIAGLFQPNALPSVVYDSSSGLSGDVPAEFALTLPDHRVLIKQLRLPLSARRHLASVLSLELDRQSPVDPAEIYYSYRILATDKVASVMTVELAMVRRRDLDGALSACQSARLRPAEIFLGSHLAGAGTVPRAPGVFSVRQGLRLSVLLLLLCLPLLALTAVTGIQGRHQDQMAELQREMATHRRASAEAERMRAAIADMRRQLDAIRAEREASRMSPVIAGLSADIPTDAWLFELQIEDRQGLAKGYAASASSLLEHIENLPGFANADFVSPLTVADEHGKERFELSFDKVN